MTTATVSVARPGRPYIGPKAQTHIPQAHQDAIVKEAKEREILYADMLREIIEDWYLARGQE